MKQRVITGVCKKCGGTVTFAIGNLSVDEAKDRLQKMKETNCIAGNHVEIVSPAELFDIDWTVKEEDINTDEAFLEKLTQRTQEAYTLEQLQEKYEIDSFFLGRCLTHNKETQEQVLFDFVHSPNGTRYYYR